MGGAIVWNSDIQDEWEETLTKTKFLLDEFQIVETIKIKDGKLLFEKEHFDRMQKTANYFGFKFKTPEIKPVQKNGILRILLDKDRKLLTEYKKLNKISTNKIKISPIIINSQNEFM